MNEVTNFRGEVDAGEAPLARDADALIAAVGSRVRNARQRKGMSRRALSELSGVSQRYLAQLEMGGGNISIGLLLKVANALNHRIEWLVGEEDPWESEAIQLGTLFSSATLDQKKQVLEILNPGHPRVLRADRICFIGLRGAGKSTLGRVVAETTGLPFIELNREIEELSGMPVDEVMALYGQEGYRKFEHQALERIVATSDSLLLAVAGGIVSEPETFSYLLRYFHTIWLTAKPEEHMERVRAQGDMRPMTGNPKAMEELCAILESREHLYSKADAVVNTAGKSLEESHRDVLRVIRAKGYLSGDGRA